MAQSTYWRRKNGSVALATKPAQEVELKFNGAVKLNGAEGRDAYENQFKTKSELTEAESDFKFDLSEAPKPGPRAKKDDDK